jgi:hypothetical protein
VNFNQSLFRIDYPNGFTAMFEMESDLGSQTAGGFAGYDFHGQVGRTAK